MKRGIPILGGAVQSVVSRIPTGLKGMTVLSIGNLWLKLIVASGSLGRRTIQHLIGKRIEGMSDEAVVEWLRATWGELGFDPGEVLIANPSFLTTSRLFALPSTNPTEIKDIVDLQVEKHTPYAKEDILTDFKILESDPSGYSRVLLVISHKDVVHRGLKLIDSLGWSLERVGFELEGLAQWLPLASGSFPEGVVLVAEVDSDTTTLVILQQGKIYFHRSLSLGARHLQEDPQEGPNKLVAELARSLESFESEGFSIQVSQIVLTGRAVGFPGLDVRVGQGIEIPTQLVDPFQGISLRDPSILQREGVADVSFASLLGLAVRPTEIDLTPAALKLHRTFEIRSRALVGLGVQVVAVFLLISCLVMGKAQKDGRYHEELLKLQESRFAQTGELEGHLTHLHLVQHWLDSGDQLLEAFIQIAKETPAQIRLKSLSFRRDQDMVVKGVSEETPKIFDYVTALERTLLFAEVKARNVTKKKENDQDVTEFEVVCRFSAPATAAPEEEE